MKHETVYQTKNGRTVRATDLPVKKNSEEQRNKVVAADKK